MLYSAQAAAKGVGCPRKSDIKAGQKGSLACCIIVARPAIIRYSFTRCSKSNQLEPSS
jgi:hypothetical protein